MGMGLGLAVSAAFGLGLFMAVGAQAATPEIRATWMTTTANTALSNLTNSTNAIRNLRQTGLNTVYVEAWKNGYTQFPSPTLKNFIGVDRTPSLGTRDLLGETVIQAHRNGMHHFAWFEYGLMAQFGNPSNPLATKMRDNGWLLQTSTGAYTTSTQGFSYMNPLVPEVRSLIKGIALDAVRQYDLDGIQFDDHLAWPVDFGYDNYTRQQYLAETGRNLPNNPRSGAGSAEFLRWRADKLTGFVTELYNELKAERPGIVVSISPSISGFSYSNFAVDWPAWLDLGLFDEYVPQVYRSTITDFNNTWPGQLAQFNDRPEDLIAGLRGNGTGADTPWADLRQMILRSRTDNARGHSVFYSKAILESYPNEFTQFYNVVSNGHAPHPDFPVDWRFPAVVGNETSSDLFTFDVPETGYYLPIVFDGTRWTPLTIRPYVAGELQLSLPGALAAELLVDRTKTFLEGDADSDGDIDFDDLGILLGNYNLTGIPAYTGGDSDGDGDIDFDDLGLLLGNYGFNVTPAELDAAANHAAQVPEPQAAIVLVPLCGLLARRIRSAA